MPPKRTELTPAQSANRKLTPKERGCFQCSRRRIICDKAEPACAKCIKKGIDCSGVNRIRFTDGVARRGRLKDCKIPHESSQAATHLPTATAFPQVRWSDESKGHKKQNKRARKTAITAAADQVPESVDRCTGAEDSVSASSVNEGGQCCAFIDTPCSAAQNSTGEDSSINEQEVVEEIIRFDDKTLATPSNHANVQPWLAPLDAGTRMLFSYFSDNIAPVMVILDTASNGYREVILPMALENDTLRRSVSVVAAQHFSRHVPAVRDVAEISRSVVIAQLRQQSGAATEDQVFDQFTWATIIVLLVGETVTGSPTCGPMMRMLMCLAENSRTRHKDSSVTRFLQTQTTMFELLGMPLTGELSGISTIGKSLQTWRAWLAHEQYSAATENHGIFDDVRRCFDDACSIYVLRATSEDSSRYHELQASTICSLISRLSHISPASDGAHALVWPCFVAGAEASDPVQRAFFAEYMNRIHARTQFRNIPIAVQSLEKLWARRGGKRWTQCLPEMSNVLVM